MKDLILVHKTCFDEDFSWFPLSKFSEFYFQPFILSTTLKFNIIPSLFIDFAARAKNLFSAKKKSFVTIRCNN